MVNSIQIREKYRKKQSKKENNFLLSLFFIGENMNIEKKIIAQKMLIENSRKNSMMKCRRKNNRMIARKKCSYQYINQFVDTRNYRSVVKDFLEKYDKGFCTSLSVDKIKPLTDEKIRFLEDNNLVYDSYSIRVKE